jgi:hypothetical protein
MAKRPSVSVTKGRILNKAGTLVQVVVVVIVKVMATTVHSKVTPPLITGAQVDYRSRQSGQTV